MLLWVSSHFISESPSKGIMSDVVVENGLNCRSRWRKAKAMRRFSALENPQHAKAKVI